MKNGLIEGCVVDGDCIACVFEDPEYTQADCDYAKKITCKEDCQYWRPDADEDLALAHIRAEARADALREAAGIMRKTMGHLASPLAMYNHGVMDTLAECEKAILSAIDQPQEDGQKVYDCRKCGYVCQSRHLPYCPNCGETY